MRWLRACAVTYRRGCRCECRNLGRLVTLGLHPLPLGALVAKPKSDLRANRTPPRGRVGVI